MPLPGEGNQSAERLDRIIQRRRAGNLGRCWERGATSLVSWLLLVGAMLLAGLIYFRWERESSSDAAEASIPRYQRGLRSVLADPRTPSEAEPWHLAALSSRPPNYTKSRTFVLQVQVDTIGILDYQAFGSMEGGYRRALASCNVIGMRRTIQSVAGIGLLCLLVSALLSACDDGSPPATTELSANTPTPLSWAPSPSCSKRGYTA